METNLRQAKAKASCEGILAEKHLEMKTDQDGTRIEGYLTIKTSDVNSVRYYVKVAQMTKGNPMMGQPPAENRAWQGMVTVMNTYRSIAEVGEAEADRVSVNGDISLYHQDKTGLDAMTYKSNFFNRLPAGEECKPKAEFDVEVFISSITDEVDPEGTPTGRAIVKGWVPQYNNGIEPIQMAAAADIAGVLQDSYQPGQTVEFTGDIVNARIEKQIPMRIGKPKIEVSYKNELVLTSASDPYGEGVSVAKAPYDPAVINAAIQERKNRIEANKAQNNASVSRAMNPPIQQARPSAASMGRVVQGW